MAAEEKEGKQNERVSSAKQDVFEQLVGGLPEPMSVFRCKYLDRDRSACQLIERLELRFYAAARRYPPVICNQLSALSAQNIVQKERGSVWMRRRNRDRPRLRGGNGGWIRVNDVDGAARPLHLGCRVEVEFDT